MSNVSKVWVDRELLARLQERLDPHIDARDWGMLCEAFRAQPAEADGVEVVAWRCEASKPGIKTQVRLVFTWPEAESFAHHYEERGCKVTTTALVEKAKHRAALSAVTAERDAFREGRNCLVEENTLLHEQIADLTEERDQLRTEAGVVMQQRDHYADRVSQLEKGALQIADDFRPSSGEESALALGEMRGALYGLVGAAMVANEGGQC